MVSSFNFGQKYIFLQHKGWTNEQSGCKNIFLVPVVSEAQGGFEDKYNISVANMEKGLPSNYVDDLFVDSAGFLWIATGGGGLCRYDGSELLTFSYTTSPSVKSNFVRNVVEDGFNRLWVASEGGLDILNLKNLTSAELDVAIPEMEDYQCCSYVTMDASGAIWTKFAENLYRIVFDEDGKVAQILSFTHPSLAPVNYVFEDVDGDGTVWAPLNGRLCKIGASGDTLAARPLNTTLDVGEDTYVSGYLKDDTYVWVSTESGLYLLHRISGEWKHYVHDASNPHSLTQNFVTGLTRMPDGQGLASTLRGLNIYNQLTDNFSHLGEEVINGIWSYRDVLLDAAELGVGTEAGLCAFQSHSARIGVRREASGLALVAHEEEKEIWRMALPAVSEEAPVWLRIRYVFTPMSPGDEADTAFLSYSLDGENWTELDYTLKMKFTLDYFIGYRSALYCMGPSGIASFDYFRQWVY